MNPSAERSVITARAGSAVRHTDVLVQEIGRTFVVDGRIMAVSICSPGDERVHGLGYLITEGLLPMGEFPESMEAGATTVSVILKHGAEPAMPEAVTSGLVLPFESLLEQARVFAGLAGMHIATGGTHSASLFLEGSPAHSREDISRTAAFEKVVGAAAEAGARFDCALLCLSSRIPAGFVHKAARARIPIISAVSAPTLQAADEAERLGICLCGFVRDGRANVYSCPWRVGL